MIPPIFCFACDKEALNLWLLAFNLKTQQCPFCNCCESLNRHSFLYGNDPNLVSGERLRGQRIFCCDRGQRGGCGRTFSVFLADVLPRFTVTASLLWQLLYLLVDGKSVQAAALSLRLPFASETLYHLLHRLRLRLDILRTCLCKIATVPQSSKSDPLLQTVEHLQAAFPGADCPIGEFQAHFQSALLG
jgi:hypothetical protein